MGPARSANFIRGGFAGRRQLGRGAVVGAEDASFTIVDQIADHIQQSHREPSDTRALHSKLLRVYGWKAVTTGITVHCVRKMLETIEMVRA